MPIASERRAEYDDVSLVALNVFNVLDEETDVFAISRPFALPFIGVEEIRIVDGPLLNSVLG